MSDLSNPIFHDETKAREWLEARVWPNGPSARIAAPSIKRPHGGQVASPWPVSVQRLPRTIHGHGRHAL